MNFTLYPIYRLAAHKLGDEEEFDLSRLPFNATEDVRIEDVSGHFSEDTFAGFKERMGTDRIAALEGVRYALVHRYPDHNGQPPSVNKVRNLAACLRLIRPMQEEVSLMQGRIREEDGKFDINHTLIPTPPVKVLPEVQNSFKLRNQDANDLRTYAPDFLRGMRGDFWKFRMAVEFHERGFFMLDWKARFLLWCSAIESVYTSHDRDHQGSLVATSRIKWFLREDTSIYQAGDFCKLPIDREPHITVGQIAGDLYDLRNYVAHGDKIPDVPFNEYMREGYHGKVRTSQVLIEAASFIIRASLLKILRDNLLDNFANASSSEVYFARQGLTKPQLLAAARKNNP